MNKLAPISEKITYEPLLDEFLLYCLFYLRDSLGQIKQKAQSFLTVLSFSMVIREGLEPATR